ncbi:MAG: hypothetical protein KKG60_00025 [Nanoarchaeota archaeon]|nr:hypothetical protein [Nanoarchaeota archaeon]
MGFFFIVLSFASSIEINKEQIKGLKKDLNTKTSIDKIWREIDKLKSKRGRKGQLDPKTLMVIVIIILVLMWLWKAGVLQKLFS